MNDPVYGEVDDVCATCRFCSPDAVTTDEDDFPIMVCDRGHATNEGKKTCPSYHMI